MDCQSIEPDERLAQPFKETGSKKPNETTTENNNISVDNTASAISKKNNIISESTEMVAINSKTTKTQHERNLSDCSNSNEINIKSDGEQDLRTKENNIETVDANIESNPNRGATDTANETQLNAQQAAQQDQPPQAPPVAANNRSILILREIDPNVSEGLVKEIFNSENCPTKPVHCQHALQNSWYVTFKNDEDACLALAYIRKHVVNWNGRPIMARYKPKPPAPSAANQPPTIHHHHHHRIVPTMVMHQQQMGGVPPLVAPNVSITSTVAATTNTQQAITNRNANASNGTIGVGGHDPIYAMNMAQPAVSTHQQQGQALDQTTPSLIDHHHHHHHHHQHQQHHHQPYGVPHQTGSPGMMHMSGGTSSHMVQHHHHLSGAPQHYGYSAVAYYSQHGPVMAPWHYTNGLQYDLSEVFVYNGLAPYPSAPKSGNQISNSTTATGSTTISSAALLGAPPTGTQIIEFAFDK